MSKRRIERRTDVATGMTYDDLITAAVTLGDLYEMGAVDAYGDDLTVRQFEVAQKASVWARESGGDPNTIYTPGGGGDEEEED